MSWFDEFKEGFVEDAQRGQDDQTKQFYRQRDIQGKDDDAIRMQKYFAEHPVIYRINEILGKADPDAVRARKELGMGPKQTMAGQLGQLGGALSYDLLNDKTRNLYWLLNAAQATGSVINELAVSAVNPDLFGTRAVRNDQGQEVKYEDLDQLTRINSPLDGKPMARKETVGTSLGGLPKVTYVPGPDVRQGRNGEARVRNYRAGTVTALGVPAGIAINSGLGLMTPFGGYEGYEAAVPRQDDPSKTVNPILEVGTKYIMGRTGNLLPYDEFRKVRPDVSPGEYKAYKAFKYDKDLDLNPFDDGQITAPGAVIKATTDGIHGPELQFLGRSLPLTTAIIPFASAVGGAVAGVRKKDTYKEGGAEYAKGNDVDRRAGRRGLIGGFAGLAAGSVVGNLLEQERRRRNQAENESYNQL